MRPKVEQPSQVSTERTVVQYRVAGSYGGSVAATISGQCLTTTTTTSGVSRMLVGDADGSVSAIENKVKIGV